MMDFGFDPIRPRSLRGHLIGLVAALAIPLIALQVWWGYRESQRVEQAAAAEALALADATALSLEQFLEQAEAALTGASADFGPHFVTGEPCDDLMQTLANIFPFLASVTAVNRDGGVACSARAIPEGTTAIEWGWFADMARDPRYAVGTPVLGEISGTWILPLVAPILDEDGRFAGALAGAVPLVGFARMLSGDRRDKNLLVTISNADRVVVARSQNAAQWVGQPLPPRRGTDEVIGPGRGIARGPDFEEVDRAWGQVELENGWWVYAGVPAETIFGPARAAAVRQIGITLLIVLVGMRLAARSYRRIGSALRELASGVPMTEDGGAVHVPEGTPTEFRAVVEQFDETLQSRNRAEEAERATRERYQSIFDNAVFGLSVSTLESGFVEVNPALVSMLGYGSAQALIDAGPDSLFPSSQVRDRLIEEAGKAGVFEDFETEWTGAGDSPISVRLNGRIIRTADGEPALQMIVQDITDEKRREETLRQTQKMEAIGQLAGGVAHDFNNLLTVIGGNMELIEDGLPPDHELLDDVGQVMDATERAASLTAQLLAFSRRQPRAPHPVNLNEVLTNMERFLVRLIGEDVTLETRFTQDLRRIFIDPGELEQIIMNLILNARDAMPTGGRVVVDTRSAASNAGGANGSADVRGILLSVHDGGIGMDPVTRKRIFEPFYTTKPMGKGTGLGLSTVYGIVQRAGGHISVKSEQGHGTTIDVWFPYARDQVDLREPVEEPVAPVGGTEKILVVEDEELVRVFVRRALEKAGYETLVACDGGEALEIVEELDTPIDLVLTDVVMPRMSGPELAERLVTLLPDTPVLYMSGYIDNVAVSEKLTHHPNALLRKPFNMTELGERVRLMLDLGKAPHDAL